MKWREANGVEDEPTRIVWRFYFLPQRLLNKDVAFETRCGYQQVRQWYRAMIREDAQFTVRPDQIRFEWRDLEWVD